jgi:deaminated glutathione amidase
MKVAAVQMVATPDVPRNLDAAASLVAQAAEQGAQLVVLPEYFCLMGHSDRYKLRLAERDGQGPIQEALSAMALKHKVWLIGGTLPMQTANPERVRNASCVYGPDGQPQLVVARGALRQDPPVPICARRRKLRRVARVGAG